MRISEPFRSVLAKFQEKHNHAIFALKKIGESVDRKENLCSRSAFHEMNSIIPLKNLEISNRSKINSIKSNVEIKSIRIQLMKEIEIKFSGENFEESSRITKLNQVNAVILLNLLN